MSKKLLFFGTSSFAAPLLRALQSDARFEVVLVITQPDRPTGRKQILTAPAIKLVAQEFGLPVFQPERMKAPETLEYLKSISFDAAVVASYGQIIPQSILDLASEKFINLHGSLLPAYRGASPITEAIKNGDAATGTTVMVMDALMDHGPMLQTTQLGILDTDTTDTLSERLAVAGASTFGDTLAAYLDGTIFSVEQNHAASTTCKLIKKEDGIVDPTRMSADTIERLVRAYTPWPLVQFERAGKKFKILSSAIADATDRDAGEYWLDRERLLLACADHRSIELRTVRPEGSNTMTGSAFFRGLR